MEELKNHCLKIVDFTTDEINTLDNYFISCSVNKKDFLLKSGDNCKFIYFLQQGCIRHFHIKDGEEITCDISLENTFFTEFVSFNSNQKSKIFFQALENSKVLSIDKKKLSELYQSNPKFEELGRKITEQVAIRNSKIATSLASDKPEERYANLLRDKPEIFNRVQQKYIANILGIKPESLSRIRKRVLQNLKS